MKVFGVVYLITNKINGKPYVGQTTQKLERRIKEHKRSDLYIDRAIRKYGWENFTVEVLKVCGSKEELDYWEKYFIKARNTRSPNGYNLTDGGEGTVGIKLTPEHCAKIVAAHTGKPLSAEHRAKIGASISGEKNPFFGKTHTDEARAIMSEIHLGETPYKNLIAELRARQLLCLDLAKFLGIACSTLSCKMHGRLNFNDSEKKKLAEILGKPIEYLLQRSE